jgi:hypothetical protein
MAAGYDITYQVCKLLPVVVKIKSEIKASVMIN